jgi:hypothetical protein
LGSIASLSTAHGEGHWVRSPDFQRLRKALGSIASLSTLAKGIGFDRQSFNSAYGKALGSRPRGHTRPWWRTRRLSASASFSAALSAAAFPTALLPLPLPSLILRLVPALARRQSTPSAQAEVRRHGECEHSRVSACIALSTTASARACALSTTASAHALLSAPQHQRVRALSAPQHQRVRTLARPIDHGTCAEQRLARAYARAFDAWFDAMVRAPSCHVNQSTHSKSCSMRAENQPSTSTATTCSTCTGHTPRSEKSARCITQCTRLTVREEGTDAHTVHTPQ